MTSRSYMIEAFASSQDTLEIVGVGGVRRPFGNAQEAEVAVVVARYIESPDFDPQEDTKVVWIGCGQLDLLQVGSRWERGESRGFAPSQIVRAGFVFFRGEDLGVGEFPPPVGLRPFPSEVIGGTNGFLLKRIASSGKSDAKAGAADPELLLLPQIELLRALFGVGSDILLELFDGIRSPIVSVDRGLIDRARSYFRDDGTAVLWLRRKVPEVQALIAAAIAVDPAVRWLHDSVFQQLSSQREWVAGHPVPINIDWPWRTPVQMELEGRWIERIGGHRRFIVTRLLSIELPVTFDKVEVHYPGAETSEDEYLPPREGRVRRANARVIVLTTGRAGSISRRPAEIGSSETGVSNRKQFKFSWVAHGNNARGHIGTIGEDPRDAGPFSTGSRQAGADPAVGFARIRRGETNSLHEPQREQKEALDRTWKALFRACRDEGWSLDALPIDGIAARQHLHGGLNFNKEPLVACVSVGARRAIIIDMGSPAGDERTLGILVSRNPEKSDRALAAEARKLCRSVEGRWRSRHLKVPPGIEIFAVNRAPQVWTNSDIYAAMLRRKIRSALKL
ncbi:hypothetical protein M2341_000277 [Sphingobium sp. B7D2B]|uniref:hypothetical protein n=1 Tax=Sphingobium sp. B7D2B TaxID=2940583 RepID=UPI00222427D5|nr:hypothetical protein [Sphingobium sp. B7D2B]MCW2364830.1 hypothetical protein [Sphingobium sp. B7D2B]